MRPILFEHRRGRFFARHRRNVVAAALIVFVAGCGVLRTLSEGLVGVATFICENTAEITVTTTVDDRRVPTIDPEFPAGGFRFPDGEISLWQAVHVATQCPSATINVPAGEYALGVADRTDDRGRAVLTDEGDARRATVGATLLPYIDSEITIVGNGATLKPAGDRRGRFFYVTGPSGPNDVPGALRLVGLTLDGARPGLNVRQDLNNNLQVSGAVAFVEPGASLTLDGVTVLRSGGGDPAYLNSGGTVLNRGRTEIVDSTLDGAGGFNSGVAWNNAVAGAEPPVFIVRGSTIMNALNAQAMFLNEAGGVMLIDQTTVTGSINPSFFKNQSSTTIDGFDAGLTIRRSAFVRNGGSFGTTGTPAGFSALLINEAGGTAVIDRVTLSNNVIGPVVRLRDGASTQIRETTISQLGEPGGLTFPGLFVLGGPLTLDHVLIDRTPDLLCVGDEGLVTVEGPSLSTNGSCAGVTSISAAQLGPLTGSPATAPLLDGSPAIDAGAVSACGPEDQTGRPRPNGAACDVGAYER